MQSKLTHLHFVGIGGIGMAALAELLHLQGLVVTGSDLKTSAVTEHLADLGIAISIGHDAAAVGRAQAVIRSSAIPAENPELRMARAKFIPVVDRGALLAEVMRTKRGIAIGGSHGKTTTTAMVAHVLETAELDPTALIGGRVPRPGGTASPTRMGKSEWLVAEVDESDGSFLLTRPVVSVLTNADPEHLDYYGSRDALLDAFVSFADSVPFWSTAILGIDHRGIAEIAPRIASRTMTFGFSESAHVRALRTYSVAGGQACEAQLGERDRFEFEIPLPGEHNIQNALASIAVGVEIGIPLETAARALRTFPGVGRRFERKGESAGIQVVDDYAHHPAEIEAALRGARSVHPGRIVALFQPHRFTRTRDCWPDFLNCFGAADEIILTDIYAASETPIEGIDSEALATAIREQGHPGASFGGSLEAVQGALPDRLQAGDLLLTLGAGDISSLGPRILAEIEARAGGGS